ncbi:MAG: lipopolysaccharide heptosyltransferase I [Nitrospina sp.]|nr:lipopolysaccharide heptosyltransferase I [Nitrospina sp.]MBT3877121.1 lipopolysaccharide heptosyltransferase I [Nitrospina sp.]MBT4556679.1 lipopolysaccharide heptosyltransferase I [Nitrospina sp.]MBT5349076.1 lipopolysaccharide heptosyltransferase I [Nitrospina sp.]MBT5653440.1 lipopolysaccharide heptosyltransferase I [Nitrospina sp.]
MLPLHLYPDFKIHQTLIAISSGLMNAHKILILKFSALGDVVHTLPVAATIRKSLPNATIVWMVEERFQDILKGNPDIDQVIPIRTKVWRKNWNRQSLSEILKTIKTLRQHKFDLVLDLHGLIKSGIIARLSGAPARAGFHRNNCKEKINALFTNQKSPYTAGGIHVVDMYLEILQTALGSVEKTKLFPLQIPDEADKKIARYFDEDLTHRPIIGINPGAGFETKQWELARFAELADRISAELGYSVLLTWGPGEKTKAQQISTHMKQKCWIAPPTSILESIGLYKRMTLLVSCDSGPLHLAAALGIPTVSIFGPTDPARNGAYGVNHATVYKVLSCSFCWKKTCPLGTKECMNRVTSDEVFEAVKSHQKITNQLS